MAHKTLIGGTAYGIKGGKTLVGGTSYSIKNGKVLINGAAYNIPFGGSGAVDAWSGTSECEINCITYANGYWVVGGRYYNGSTSYARIAYAIDPAGPWTTKDLWSDTKGNSAIYCITYANGYWVVGGQYYKSGTGSGAYGSYYYARLACATSLTGTWTTDDLIGSTGGTSRVYCITYAEGYWVIGLGVSGLKQAKVWYSNSTSPLGAWTVALQWGTANATGYSYASCITYANGYWVVGGKSYDGNTSYAQVHYATTPDSSWYGKSLWSTTTEHYADNMASCIIYTDGYWVIGGGYPWISETARIAYSTSLDGTWTIQDLWSVSLEEEYFPAVHGITRANGYWVVCGIGSVYSSSGNTYYAKIAYSTSLDGTWTIQDLWSGTGENALNCIAFANDNFVTAGMYYDGSTYYARIAYTNDGVNFAVS